MVCVSPAAAPLESISPLLAAQIISAHRKAVSLSRLWAVQTSTHSCSTLSNPRSRNCRNPRACLICPNTGSTVCLSQSVPAAITGALQLLPHFLRHLAADLARGLGRMLGSPGSDISVDPPGRERQKIVL